MNVEQFPEIAKAVGGQRGGKYLKRIPKPGGGYKYVYIEPEAKRISKEQMGWESASPEKKVSLVTQAGWTNRKGELTPTGKRISRQPWEKLSVAEQNILGRILGKEA